MKIMIIPDLHIPFMEKNFLKFLADVKKAEKPDMFIQIGDLVDNHALGRWMKDPDGFSSGHEWDVTRKELEEIYQLFPDVVWVKGNHDRRPFNKAFEMGLPEKMVRPLEEIFESPNGWEVVDEVIVNGVLFTHGEGAGGQSGWQNFCKMAGLSTCAGHFHGVGGVRYFTMKNDKVLFSLQVGCGVDRKSYAMAYGKHAKNQPMLGCGIINNGKYAKFIPMDKDYYEEQEELNGY